jgi:hypothetical protein
VPPSVGLGLFPFVFVFFSFDFEHHCIGFFFLLKIFGSFGFFFMPPSFVWTLLMIENFLLCPPVLFGHFQSLRFFFSMSLALAPSVVCDPSHSYFQKMLLGSKGDYK